MVRLESGTDHNIPFLVNALRGKVGNPDDENGQGIRKTVNRFGGRCTFSQEHNDNVVEARRTSGIAQYRVNPSHRIRK
jgi:lipoate-protein ligase A